MTDYSEEPYGTLMNVARSANDQFSDVDIETNAPKKGELLTEMDDTGIEFDGDEWSYDGEEIDRLPVQTPDSTGGDAEPRDKTVLYCLTRAETTDERVEEIAQALEENTDFVVDEAGNSGDKYSIVLPAENDPEQEHFFAEGEESDESAESEVEGEDDPDGGEEDESDESPVEAEESDEDDDRSPVERMVSEHTRDELYNAAVEADIEGRGDMTKAELASALANDGVEQVDVQAATAN